MAIDADVSVTARFFERWMTAGRLKEVLAGLPDDHRLYPNRVGNLTAVRPDGTMAGFVDFNGEEFEETDGGPITSARSG